MPSLKDLKVRIESVKSTRKITSAMKMVAAAKLRRAQEQAEAARPYAQAMARLMASLAANAQGEALPTLVTGNGKDETILLVVVTSDRGLCGAFNGTVVREARRQVRDLKAAGKTVKILCVGRKGREILRREFPESFIGSVDDLGRPKLTFADAARVQAEVLRLFETGAFDRAMLVYNQFRSAISQVTTVDQLIPVPLPAAQEAGEGTDTQSVYEFEPDAASILADLLPKSMGMKIYGVLMESAAGEQGARMTAMDNATRNAGDMINRLTLVYNRTRQAYITKELIEIISGAEAV